MGCGIGPEGVWSLNSRVELDTILESILLILTEMVESIPWLIDSTACIDTLYTASLFIIILNGKLWHPEMVPLDLNLQPFDLLIAVESIPESFQTW